MRGTKAIIGGTLAVVLIAALAVGGWFLLRDDDKDAQAQGTCGAARYELSVEPSDGALDVDLDLSSSTPGEVWDVVVEQNATVLYETRRTTEDDAELDVDVSATPSGDDEFVVTATPESGEVCTARLTYS